MSCTSLLSAGFGIVVGGVTQSLFCSKAPCSSYSVGNPISFLVVGTAGVFVEAINQQRSLRSPFPISLACRALRHTTYIAESLGIGSAIMSFAKIGRHNCSDSSFAVDVTLAVITGIGCGISLSTLILRCIKFQNPPTLPETVPEPIDV